MAQINAIFAMALGVTMTLGLAAPQSVSAEPPNVDPERASDAWEHLDWHFETEQPLALETAERPLAEADLPSRALDALREAAGEYELNAFEEEIRNGKRYFAGEWRAEDHEEEATVTAEGVLVEIERGVPEQVVPRGVIEAAAEVAGGGAVSYERRSIIYYEIEYEIDGQEHEMLLSATGDRIATERPPEQVSGRSTGD